jgi:hypothetical protein
VTIIVTKNNGECIISTLALSELSVRLEIVNNNKPVINDGASNIARNFFLSILTPDLLFAPFRTTDLYRPTTPIISLLIFGRYRDK